MRQLRSHAYWPHCQDLYTALSRDGLPAHAATCTRDLKPSLLRISLTQTSTVPSLITRNVGGVPIAASGQ
jgi:hypothetical protein